MCGIAGVIDLAGERPVPAGVIESMAEAIVHRGPDEDGFLVRPGLAFASRRLSIVGLADGRQPIWNEDRSVGVVFNGEFFDYPEKRHLLERRGHRLRTRCDTELIPHFWEDHQEEFFPYLQGQFAFALWDQNRRQVILARDRFGIAPLYWTQQDNWLLFASEIKALLASGLVTPRPDLSGIDQVFTFFALPGPATCFQGIRTLLPGHYLKLQLDGRPGTRAAVEDKTYWEIDFPDAGTEDRGRDAGRVLDQFEALLRQAVEERLRADVPVVSYLSGGVDSGTVVALASQVRGGPIPTFTIRITDPKLDETGPATRVARRLGVEPVVVNCSPADVVNTYPELVEAVEGPVIDTSSAALLMLAREVHGRGFKVALTGEGSDEWLAGYPWYKVHRLVTILDSIPAFPVGTWLKRAYLRLAGAPEFPWELACRNEAALGGPNAWLNPYGLMSLSKLRFYSRPMLDLAMEQCPYAQLGLNLDRMRRWHPFHRSLYVGARVLLPGLLLHGKGDRVAMHSSVETRYPFLDEDVFRFLARLHPSWKLHGFKDKYLLRRLAERWLPPDVAWRPKAIFRAPFDAFFGQDLPPYIDQLLSTESLRKTGYFDPEKVHHGRQVYHQLRPDSLQRTSIEMGLAGVVATQLWHQTFLDDSLADLPSRAAPARAAVAV